ncbi:MAG: hypothetical protein AAGD38_16320 [Acidobacteriota bacterium]
MTAEEAIDRVLEALALELRKTRRIGEIEAKIGRSRGYFSKVVARKWRISLDLLMQTLEVLEVDPPEFFARALDIKPDPEALLADMDGENTAERLERLHTDNEPRSGDDHPALA